MHMLLLVMFVNLEKLNIFKAKAFLYKCLPNNAFICNLCYSHTYIYKTSRPFFLTIGYVLL